MNDRTPDTGTTPEPASRRAFIRLVGGGAVLAAGLGGAGCASGLPEAAVQPWRTATAETELRRFMLAHTLLAPNPHNRQPWIADLREPGRIHLLCDGERLLPETDPFGRQILIGCGAFIELAVIAAAERGHAVTVTLFPQGAPAARSLPAGTVVATLTPGPAGSAPRDPLYAAIARRHTAKTAYAEGRPLPEALAAAWVEAARRHGLQAGTVTAPEPLAALRRIAREAYEIEAVTPATWLESARLMRIGPDAIARHRDGISLSSPMIRMLHATGLFDPMQVPQRGQSSLQRVMDHWTPYETGSG
ncbi:MAG: twin-arginine translocation pathway signal protein, partial [Rubrivivax sp.]